MDVLKWSKLFQKFLKGSERFQSLFRRFLNFPVLSRSSKFLDTNTFFILLLTDLNNLFHSLKVICACAQYLMVEYQMNLNQALAYIFQIHNSYSFQLDDCYFDYLGQLQNYLRHLSTSMNIPRSVKRPGSFMSSLLSLDKQILMSSKSVPADARLKRDPIDSEDALDDSESCENSGATHTQKTNKRNFKLAWMWSVLSFFNNNFQ